MTAAPIAEGTAPAVLGVETIMRWLYENRDRAFLWNDLTQRTKADPADAAAWLDLSFLMQALGQREQALRIQAAATTLQPVYRRVFGSGAGPRVAAFMAAGDLMANTPIDFLLQGSDATLFYVYVAADTPHLPDMPDLDAAFLAVGPSAENRPILENLGRLLRDWRGPKVMNGNPTSIDRLTRDGVAALLSGEETILSPATAKVSREELQALAAGDRPVGALLAGHGFPLVARPEETHAGEGMARVTVAGDLAAYLDTHRDDAFFISPFVDYSSPDGLFRKQRIVFIDGEAFPSHQAVSEHWIVHYLSAGMLEHADRRHEEARWMETFRTDFAVRHAGAFAALSQSVGLDYFGIDCAQTHDGRLLVFEVDIAMIVHDMDSETIFPYKKPAMRQVFATFQRSLLDHGAGSADAEG